MTPISRGASTRNKGNAGIIFLLINRAQASENPNIMGTFKLYLREGDGMQKAAATELAKRVNGTGGSARLESENIRLNARLYELEKRFANVEKEQMKGKSRKPIKMKQGAGILEDKILCPSPTGRTKVTMEYLQKGLRVASKQFPQVKSTQGKHL